MQHATTTGILAVGLWIGAIAPGSELRAPASRPASTSVEPAERSQEALLRELAQPPFLPPEIFGDLPYAVPAPIIGTLGVEVE